MLAGYFDDSGTHGHSPAVVWGGLVGTTEQWAALDAAWRALLAKPFGKDGGPTKPPLTKFGTADCHRHRREFSGYNDAESDRIQNLFRQIIVESGVIGLVYGGDRLVWDRLVKGEARDYLGDVEMICFGECIRGAMRISRRYFPDEEEIALYFDKGRQSPQLTRQINTWDSGYSGCPEIVSYNFVEVSKYAPLQAADMVATYFFWQVRETLECSVAEAPPSAHFRHFLERTHIHCNLCDEVGARLTLRLNGFDEAGARLS